MNGKNAYEVEKNIRTENRFKGQYEPALNYFFGKTLIGITGVKYVPEFCILPQPHSDHLPDLHVLENRLKKTKNVVDIFIPTLSGNEIILNGILKRYHEKLLRKPVDKWQDFSNLKSKLNELQNEFDNIKIQKCGKILMHDDITVEFFEAYEAPSYKYPEPSLLASMLVEKRNKNMSICLESEENQIAYIGESIGPQAKLHEMIKNLNPKSAEVILTPPQPNYPKNISYMPAEKIDMERERLTKTYKYVNPSVKEILAVMEKEHGTEFSITIDPCHAEGIISRPEMPVLVQTFPCIERSLFREKNKQGIYVEDVSYHHYLARLLGHHYEIDVSI